MSIRPVTMFSPVNFKAKKPVNKTVESVSFVDQNDGYKVQQIRQNGILVYERRELNDLNYAKRHIKVREFWKNGNVKSLHEEKLEKGIETTIDANYDKDGKQYYYKSNVDASDICNSYPW